MSGDDDDRSSQGGRVHKVTRVADGQTHADVIALPDWHFVLVDVPLDPVDTVTYTETLPLQRPALEDAKPKQLVDTMKTKLGDPSNLQDDARFYFKAFAQTADGSTLTLSVKRGASVHVLFEDVPSSEIQKDEQRAPRRPARRVGSLLSYTLPHPKPPSDKVLEGKEVDFDQLVFEEPKVVD